MPWAGACPVECLASCSDQEFPSWDATRAEPGRVETRGLAENEMVVARAGAFVSGRRSCASDRY